MRYKKKLKQDDIMEKKESWMRNKEEKLRGTRTNFRKEREKGGRIGTKDKQIKKN